jgi:hypothetical protein
MRSLMIYTPHQIYLGNQFEKIDERECSKYGEEERSYGVLVGKSEGKM